MLLLFLLLSLLLSLISPLTIDGIEYNREIKVNDNDILWKDARDLTLGGLAEFTSGINNDKELPFDRLPLSAKSIVTEGVWNQSVESAGVYVEFITDATAIYINYTLYYSNTDLWNMDEAGYSSVDILAYDTQSNMYRWMNSWAGVNYPNNSGLLVDGIQFKEPTLYRLNFPLYNRVSAFSVGVPVDTKIFTENVHKDSFQKRTIVYYGTSIAQGKSASVPSSAYISQLDASNYPRYSIYNFGFSSNGKMDLNVMGFLNAIPNVDMMIIDCLPNMNYEEVANSTIPLVKSIRATHSTNLPILLVESTIYGSEWFNPVFKSNQQKKRDTLKAQYDILISDGYTNLFYVSGNDIIAPQEVSVSYKVDGTHPNDLGMHKMFEFWTKYLKTFNW